MTTKTTFKALGDVHIPRKGTKTFRILKGMTTKRGLTIEDIVKITGWQRASAYSAISDDMRKRCGMTVKRVDDHYLIHLPRNVHL